MPLSVPRRTGRDACAESVGTFLHAVDELDELELLGASRCHGWTRLDVVVHVLAGWQEMLGGLVSPVDDEPTVDAASYWPVFAREYGGGDPVPQLMAQRRRTAAYSRPSSATTQLHDVAAALLRGLDVCPDRLRWQGQVFAAGDFLATWAVEHVVHQLDLETGAPISATGLGLARATVEDLAGEPLPASWSDLDATLVGTGRRPVPDELRHERPSLAARLPALG